jgi:hypothetical protein
MANILDETYTMCDKLGDTLSDINGKLKNTKGALPNADLDYVDRLLHSIKSAKTVIAMEEAYDDDYSENYRGSYNDHSMRHYDDRGERSMARGRRNARRDSMGRYSRDDYSERGYSRTSAKDEMVDDLREMMKMTDDDRVRQEMQDFISKMEKMR